MRQSGSQRSCTAWLLRELVLRWRDAYRALPGRSLPILLTGIGAAWVACALVMAGLTDIAQAIVDDGLHDWDNEVMIAIRDHSPLTFIAGIMLESPGNLLILGPVIIFSVIIAIWHGRILFAITLPLSYFLARFLIWEGWWMWARERPKMIADGVASHSAHSFPSGHILLAILVYGLLTWLWVEASRSAIERVVAWVLPLTVGCAVGYSRLLLGSHWPSDCIVGLFMGILYLVLIIVALRIAEGHARRQESVISGQ